MASLSDIVCDCKNTCNRVTKRGACPCRIAGRLCSQLCSCGWMMPCINRDTRQERPTPIDVDPDELCATREELELIDSEDDWCPPQQPATLPTPSSGMKRKKSTNRRRDAKRRPNVTHMVDNEMEVDEIQDETPARQKRKRSAATASRVRRRLEVGELSTLEEAREADEQAPDTQQQQQLPVAVTAHHQSVQNFASSLDETQLRLIVIELLFRDQGAFQDYILGYRPGQTSDDPTSPPHPEGSPAWCRCGNCRPMPTNQENKCCWMRGAVQCVTDSPNFYTVITPAILDIAMAHYNDFMVHDQQRSNGSYRHQAYRQFVLQRYGRLGHGNRRVVASCVVLAIRRRFPDPRGIYTGFHAQ